MRRSVVVGVILVVGVCSAVGLVTGIVPLDGDSIPPLEELESGTDPLDRDTDKDLLDDDQEGNGTDPLDRDTDGDGLSDGLEVFRHPTGPASNDTDSDGLSDELELEEYETDPTAADSDGDGLDDRVEIHKHGTDPTASDMDDDGLADHVELTKHDTNVTMADTDGDGLPDGPELDATDKLPGADPLRMDVYVEIDYMPGTTLSSAERRRLTTTFDEAPVTNPSGEDGIALHLFVDEEVPRSDPVYFEHGGDDETIDEIRDYRKEFFDNASLGYHYTVLTDRKIHNRNETAYGYSGGGLIMVFDQGSTLHDGRVFMHELGHSLGLRNTEHAGIDSTQYSYAEYPSVMNYNGVQKAYVYSNGTNSEHDFDDWGYLDDHINSPSISDLRGPK